MNKRIKKLAKQATKRISNDGKDFWLGRPHYREVLDKEKFAELLIRECVKLQYKNVIVGGVSDYNRGRRELAEEILKHFGVEE